MHRIPSYDDLDSLREVLGAIYPIRATQIQKHRDWIGYVYQVATADKRYVFKLYRSFHAENAENAVGILQFLTERGYPVPGMVCTLSGPYLAQLDTPGGQSLAILFEHVDGTEPQWEQEYRGDCRTDGYTAPAYGAVYGSAGEA